MHVGSVGTRLGRFGIFWDDFFFWIKSDWIQSTIASKRSLNFLHTPVNIIILTFVQVPSDQVNIIRLTFLQVPLAPRWSMSSNTWLLIHSSLPLVDVFLPLITCINPSVSYVYKLNSQLMKWEQYLHCCTLTFLFQLEKDRGNHKGMLHLCWDRFNFHEKNLWRTLVCFKKSYKILVSWISHK